MIKEKFISLFILLVFAPLVSAQLSAPITKGSETKPFSWSSMKNLPSVTPFVALDGRFSVGLLPQIQGIEAFTPKQLGSNISGRKFTWKFNEGDVVIAFFDYSENELQGTEADLKRITENSKSKISKNQPDGKFVKETFFKIGEFYASQIKFSLPENRYQIQRTYLVKNRLYQIIAIFQNSENETYLNQTLDTFKLFTQSDIDAELKKKYEAMKPQALPQEPVVPRLKSDVQDEGFKGKVKKVIEESEDLSGTWSVQGRKMSSITYFNDKGNLVQRDSYDFKGFPFSIAVYGYIDGKRVSTDNSTKYDDNPPIMAPRPTSKNEEVLSKPDLRYKMSYEFKYLDESLVEKIWRFNTGKLWLKYEYKYSKNIVEEIVYTADGKINQHYVNILDDNGNKLEERSLDVLKIYGEKKYNYEYVFDGQGNWIKRITVFEETRNNVASKISWVTYRTITYY